MRELALFFCSVALLFAQDQTRTTTPPDSYHVKGDVPGESIDAYRKNNPECKDKDTSTRIPNFHLDKESGKWSGMCTTLGESMLITYANAIMQAKLVTFSADRLVQITYLAKHDAYYETLKANLIAKFGEPTTKVAKDYQNRMGAHFRGESLEWNNGVSSIALEEYGGDLNTSGIAFSLNEFTKQQKDMQKLKKPSPDM
jgi:hypothetical protein